MPDYQGSSILATRCISAEQHYTGAFFDDTLVDSGVISDGAALESSCALRFRCDLDSCIDQAVRKAHRY